MGRKRKDKGKKREPISVSLPSDLIQEWDRLLGPRRTRSRWLEALLRREFIGSQSSLQRTEWQCNECGYAWATNRPIVSFCASTDMVNGEYCRSDKIQPFDEGVEE